MCEAEFRDLGIPFEASYQDFMVYQVYRAFGSNPAYAKQLILCWFHHTYDEWDGLRVDTTPAREQMSAFLETVPYGTFEQLLASRIPEEDDYARRTQAESESGDN